MATKLSNYLGNLVLSLCLCWAANVSAATVSTECRYLANNRSIVVVRASLPRGNYYARVYSYNLERWISSRPKATDANGLIRFDFDSLKRPGWTLLPPQFNKSGKAGGTIRKYAKNTRMGGITSPCLLR